MTSSLHRTSGCSTSIGTAEGTCTRSSVWKVASRRSETRARAVPFHRWFEQESERLRKPPSPRSFRVLGTLFDDDLQVAIAQAGFSKQSGRSVDSLDRFLIGLIRFRASLQAELIGAHAEIHPLHSERLRLFLREHAIAVDVEGRALEKKLRERAGAHCGHVQGDQRTVGATPERPTIRVRGHPVPRLDEREHLICEELVVSRTLRTRLRRPKGRVGIGKIFPCSASSARVIDSHHHDRRNLATSNQPPNGLVHPPFVRMRTDGRGIEERLPVVHVQHRIGTLLTSTVRVSGREPDAKRTGVPEDVALEVVRPEVAHDLRVQPPGDHAEGGCRRKGEKRNDERSVPGRHGRDALVGRVRSHLPR